MYLLKVKNLIEQLGKKVSKTIKQNNNNNNNKKQRYNMKEMARDRGQVQKGQPPTIVGVTKRERSGTVEGPAWYTSTLSTTIHVPDPKQATSCPLQLAGMPVGQTANK